MTGKGVGHGAGARVARVVRAPAAAWSWWAAVRALPRPPSSEVGGADGAGAGPAEAMFVARSIAADHKDLIHDVSFDFHGRRMATCSSDQSVKVRAELLGGAEPRRRGSGDLHDPLLERRERRVERGLPRILRHAAGHEVWSPRSVGGWAAPPCLPQYCGVTDAPPRSLCSALARGGGRAGVLATCALPPVGPWASRGF